MVERDEARELLIRIVERQDALEARCARVEAVLRLTPVAPGVAHDQPIADAIVIAPPPWIPAERAAPPPRVLAPPAPRAQAPVTRGATPGQVEARTALAWVNRVGVVTLVLGVAFAFKTAVDHDWLGPVARVAVGIAGAVLALAIGERMWRRDQVVFAHGLTGLGISVLYLSLWASCSLYHLLGQPAAFGWMAATTIGAAALAARYRSQAIAILGLIGGYITPIALSTGEPHSLFFLTYLAMLNAGAIAGARNRRWPLVEAFAAVATVALYGGWLASADERAIGSGFLIVFAIQLALARPPIWRVGQVLAPLAAIALWATPYAGLPGSTLPLFAILAAIGIAESELRRDPLGALWTVLVFWGAVAISLIATIGVGARPEVVLERPVLQLVVQLVVLALTTAWSAELQVRIRRQVGGAALTIALVNAVAAAAAGSFLLANGAADPAARIGPFLFGLALAHAGLAARLWRDPDPRPRAVAAALAVTLTTVAVPVQLSGPWITLAWLGSGVVLAGFARRFDSGTARIGAMATLALAAIHLAATDLDLLAATAFVNTRFATCAAVAAGLFVAARWSGPRALGRVAYLAGHAILLFGLGVELAAVAAAHYVGSERTQAISVAITILLATYAVALVASGFVRGAVRDRVVGLAVLGLAVLKLYLSDVWELGLGFRIVAFIGLGALLLVVSYLYSRYRAAIEQLWRTRP
jgi:uncharacterized membrane protein